MGSKRRPSTGRRRDTELPLETVCPITDSTESSMDSFYQSAIVHLTAAIDNKNTDNGSEVNAQFLQAETQIQRGLTASKKVCCLV